MNEKIEIKGEAILKLKEKNYQKDVKDQTQTISKSVEVINDDASGHSDTDNYFVFEDFASIKDRLVDININPRSINVGVRLTERDSDYGMLA